MNLIFLDVDGVLNNHRWDREASSTLIDFDKIKLLNQILIRTESHVVLSSAWRYIIHRGEANLTGLDWLLRSHGLMAQRLVGYTSKDTLCPHWDGHTHNYWPVRNERGYQIQKWMNANCDVDPNYLVIDNGGFDNETKIWTDLGLGANGHPVLWTHPKVGLTATLVEIAVDFLQQRITELPPSPMIGKMKDEI